MRPVFLFVGGCALACGCAQVIGLEDWKDPSSGVTGSGGSTSVTASSSAGTGGAPTASHAAATSASVGTGNVSCADGMKNGLETDVDCGGDACPPCALGKGCANGADCQTGTCVAKRCVSPPDAGPPCDMSPDPTCHDCKKNALETDVDCGGDSCAPCGAGKGCVSGADCTTGSCDANHHCAAGTPGQPCHDAADCSSQMCTAGSCWTGSCCL